MFSEKSLGFGFGKFGIVKKVSVSVSVKILVSSFSAVCLSVGVFVCNILSSHPSKVPGLSVYVFCFILTSLKGLRVCLFVCNVLSSLPLKVCLSVCL